MELLRERGPTAEAFTFRAHFRPPGRRMLWSRTTIGGCALRELRAFARQRQFLPRPVKISGPPSAPTTRSSIRTPNRSGRYARLDGHDHARLERILWGQLGQPRRLVDLNAHPVAEAMAEVVAVAGDVDDDARGRVDLAPIRARDDRVQSRELGGADDLVDLARVVRHAVAGRVGAGAVRAVAVEHMSDSREHVAVDQLVAGTAWAEPRAP